MTFDGLDWALPHIAHPDEARVVGYVIASPSDSPGPLFSDYGTVPFHLLRLVGSVAAVIAPGYSIYDPEDVVFTYVLARAVAAAFGFGTVVLVYLAAARAYGRNAGLLAAAFMAFSVLGIQQSHSFTVDVVLVFWTALFLAVALRLIDRPRDYLYVGLALVTGIAVATKFVALFLLLPLVLAYFFAGKKSDSDRGVAWHLPSFSMRLATYLLAALIVSTATFIVLTPNAVTNAAEYWLLDFAKPEWWWAWDFPAGSHRLLWNILLAEGTVRPLWSAASTPSLRLINPITGLLTWGMGPALLVLSGVGIIAALRRRTPVELFLLGFLFAAYVSIASSHVQFIRYVYPIVPVLAMLAARPLDAIPDRWANGRWVKLAMSAAVAVVLTAGAMYSFAFASIYRETDTRLQAAEWIHQNIPPGAKVGLDGPEVYAEPFMDPSVYRIHLLPIYRLHAETTPRVYSGGLFARLLGDGIVPTDNTAYLSLRQVAVLIQQHLESDYIILSNPLLRHMGEPSEAAALLRAYHISLIGQVAGFELVQVFESLPRLWGVTIDDTNAEWSFRIFDHPTIHVYRKRPP